MSEYKRYGESKIASTHGKVRSSRMMQERRWAPTSRRRVTSLSKHSRAQGLDGWEDEVGECVCGDCGVVMGGVSLSGTLAVSSACESSD